MWKPDISIVIPVFNEEENLPILVPQIITVLQSLNKNYEIILVDDGSTDKSLLIIKELCKKYMEVKYIKFQHNCGQTAAFDAGFKAALGSTVVTLDADLQNDPKDIPNLLSYIPEYDAVCGWRSERQDSFNKRISSIIANNFRRFFLRDKIHDVGCSLKIFKKEWLEKIKLYKGMHRFLPVLLEMEGAKTIEIKVNHLPRIYGYSKYNTRKRLFSGLSDLFSVRWMQKRRINYEISERS